MAVSVSLSGDELVVTAPPNLAGRIGRIPGLYAVRGDDAWRGPVTLALLEAVKSDISKLPGFSPSKEVTARFREYAQARSLIEQIKSDPPLPRSDDGDLYPYQRVGVWMMAELGTGMLLGDEMGTGKTVMSLVAARRAGHETILVVAPNSMKYRWAEEAEVWYPELDVVVIDGTASKKAKAFEQAQEMHRHGVPLMVVTNWEALRTQTRIAGYGSIKLTDKDKEDGPLNSFAWDCVIADEAHRAKDPKAKQTRALWYVGRDVAHCWALTGTPMLNTPGDLWAIGRFYDPVTYGTSRHDWHNRFVDYLETRWGPEDIGLRPDREAEFLSWFDVAFLRRTKDECLDLPDVSYQTRHVPMTSKQATAYTKMQKDLIARIGEGILVASDPLALLTRLSQIASATPVVEDGEVVSLTSPSNKINTLLEILDEAGESEQVVVFAMSRKLIEETGRVLTKRGITYMEISGNVNAAMRAANVNLFQRGERRVALCTLAAGSEGINLFSSSTAVFLQRSYSMGQSLQAEARVHRIGQTRPVTVIDIVSPGTVDEAVIAAVQSKSEMAEQILRDHARQLLQIRETT